MPDTCNYVDMNVQIANYGNGYFCSMQDKLYQFSVHTVEIINQSADKITTSYMYKYIHPIFYHG